MRYVEMVCETTGEVFAIAHDEEGATFQIQRHHEDFGPCDVTFRPFN